MLLSCCEFPRTFQATLNKMTGKIEIISTDRKIINSHNSSYTSSSFISLGNRKADKMWCPGHKPKLREENTFHTRTEAIKDKSFKLYLKVQLNLPLLNILDIKRNGRANIRNYNRGKGGSQTAEASLEGNILPEVGEKFSHRSWWYSANTREVSLDGYFSIPGSISRWNIFCLASDLEYFIRNWSD